MGRVSDLQTPGFSEAPGGWEWIWGGVLLDTALAPSALQTPSLNPEIAAVCTPWPVSFLAGITWLLNEPSAAIGRLINVPAESQSVTHLKRPCKSLAKNNMCEFHRKLPVELLVKSAPFSSTLCYLPACPPWQQRVCPLSITESQRKPNETGRSHVGGDGQ